MSVPLIRISDPGPSKLPGDRISAIVQELNKGFVKLHNYLQSIASTDPPVAAAQDVANNAKT